MNANENKKLKNQSEQDAEFDSFLDISNTVSSCECTGSMYVPPQNEDEFESYQELTNMQIPKNNKDKNRDK